ncbi:hypothetical protein TNCV_4257591 [Trichonephila clavipes]|nr:hypothetical protein TNCV_4257591 [Trichonephila clavipes]
MQAHKVNEEPPGSSRDQEYRAPINILRSTLISFIQEAWRVVGRLEEGQTQAEVAQAIGVSQSVISRI